MMKNNLCDNENEELIKGTDVKVYGLENLRIQGITLEHGCGDMRWVAACMIVVRVKLTTISSQEIEKTITGEGEEKLLHEGYIS